MTQLIAVKVMDAALCKFILVINAEDYMGGQCPTGVLRVVPSLRTLIDIKHQVRLVGDSARSTYIRCFKFLML